MDIEGKCCFCGASYNRYGNDIRPLHTQRGSRCCDKCNIDIVIPNRIKFWGSLNGYCIIQEGLPINREGVPESNLIDIGALLIFKDEEEATKYIKSKGLTNCSISHIILYEEGIC